MLNIGYSRLGIGVYVAHTDILRGLNKVFRRAGLDIEYTNGMSKHMDLRMSPPLPLGIETAEEWVAAKIDTNLSEPEIIDLFNKNAPEFLKAKYAIKTTKNPNVAGIVRASKYIIHTNTDLIAYKDRIYALKESCPIIVERNDIETTIDMKDRIYDIQIKGQDIYCILSFGNINLRIDKFLEKINNILGMDLGIDSILRLEQYTEKDNKLISIKEYLETYE